MGKAIVGQTGQRKAKIQNAEKKHPKNDSRIRIELFYAGNGSKKTRNIEKMAFA